MNINHLYKELFSENDDRHREVYFVHSGAFGDAETRDYKRKEREMQAGIDDGTIEVSDIEKLKSMISDLKRDIHELGNMVVGTESWSGFESKNDTPEIDTDEERLQEAQRIVLAVDAAISATDYAGDPAKTDLPAQFKKYKEAFKHLAEIEYSFNIENAKSEPAEVAEAQKTKEVGGEVVFDLVKELEVKNGLGEINVYTHAGSPFRVPAPDYKLTLRKGQIRQKITDAGTEYFIPVEYGGYSLYVSSKHVSIKRSEKLTPTQPSGASSKTEYIFDGTSTNFITDNLLFQKNSDSITPENLLILARGIQGTRRLAKAQDLLSSRRYDQAIEEAKAVIGNEVHEAEAALVMASSYRAKRDKKQTDKWLDDYEARVPEADRKTAAIQAREWLDSQAYEYEPRTEHTAALPDADTLHSKTVQSELRASGLSAADKDTLRTRLDQVQALEGLIAQKYLLDMGNMAMGNVTSYYITIKTHGEEALKQNILTELQSTSTNTFGLDSDNINSTLTPIVPSIAEAVTQRIEGSVDNVDFAEWFESGELDKKLQALLTGSLFDDIDSASGTPDGVLVVKVRDKAGEEKILFIEKGTSSLTVKYVEGGELKTREIKKVEGAYDFLATVLKMPWIRALVITPPDLRRDLAKGFVLGSTTSTASSRASSAAGHTPTVAPASAPGEVTLDSWFTRKGDEVYTKPDFQRTIRRLFEDPGHFNSIAGDTGEGTKAVDVKLEGKTYKIERPNDLHAVVEKAEEELAEAKKILEAGGPEADAYIEAQRVRFGNSSLDQEKLLDLLDAVEEMLLMKSNPEKLHTLTTGTSMIKHFSPGTEAELVRISEKYEAIKAGKDPMIIHVDTTKKVVKNPSGFYKILGKGLGLDPLRTSYLETAHHGGKGWEKFIGISAPTALERRTKAIEARVFMGLEKSPAASMFREGKMSDLLAFQKAVRDMLDPGRSTKKGEWQRIYRNIYKDVFKKEQRGALALFGNPHFLYEMVNRATGIARRQGLSVSGATGAKFLDSIAKKQVDKAKDSVASSFADFDKEKILDPEPITLSKMMQRISEPGMPIDSGDATRMFAIFPNTASDEPPLYVKVTRKRGDSKHSMGSYVIEYGDEPAKYSSYRDAKHFEKNVLYPLLDKRLGHRARAYECKPDKITESEMKENYEHYKARAPKAKETADQIEAHGRQMMVEVANAAGLKGVEGDKVRRVRNLLTNHTHKELIDKLKASIASEKYRGELPKFEGEFATEAQAKIAWAYLEEVCGYGLKVEEDGEKRRLKIDPRGFRYSRETAASDVLLFQAEADWDDDKFGSGKKRSTSRVAEAFGSSGKKRPTVHPKGKVGYTAMELLRDSKLSGPEKLVAEDIYWTFRRAIRSEGDTPGPMFERNLATLSKDLSSVNPGTQVQLEAMMAHVANPKPRIGWGGTEEGYDALIIKGETVDHLIMNMALFTMHGQKNLKIHKLEDYVISGDCAPCESGTSAFAYRYRRGISDRMG